ncbi:MAG: hypothetical protein E7399_05865, partial [Ruminococcaceae bacterium]|nr:hypothetical protein [Oscillospiraceae bacterium]
ERAWIQFLSVDYKTDVFVNGEYAGSHEGFFAPFSFDITDLVKEGKNDLRVVVKNDFIQGGNESPEGHSYGEKIYAATGFGWDDPEVGWHHCPPGFGICHKVFLEVKSETFIEDLFPRVNDHVSELWIDCHSSLLKSQNVSFDISVFGQNFEEKTAEYKDVVPTTCIEAGVGDTFTRAKLIADGRLGAGTPLFLERGLNSFILPIEIPNPRIWSNETPWLYQVQVTMKIDGKAVSNRSCQFGVRTFTQDVESEPKGKFYLNGKEIRLRGANTMGYEQQDVMHEDFDQLIDDILIAKLCNMNFLRITQRPVQSEIYDYCDRLGLMVQTDLPLFGCLRINQYCEALRQTGEMERLIRSHPCCILNSYINEPFPNAHNKPQCFIIRKNLMNFFDAADDVIHMYNPDRVTKHVDGDYDPPNKLLPDNHCYTLWYNGHGLDFGKLHKGYWLAVKPGWHFGCGEYGAEGLDFADLMKRRYPEEWIQEPFDPARIIQAQTASFHYCFYETPHSMEEWVEESHKHQYFATKMMTAAMRRNENVNTFAIHLFIDAFPSGWMKTIMDCERRPKPAFFAYRDCLEPTFCSLRSDRFRFFGGETVNLESYLCCDNERPATLRFFAEVDGQVIASGKADSRDGNYQGMLSFETPAVSERKVLKVVMAAVDGDEVIQTATEHFELFPFEAQKPFTMLEYEIYDQNREMYDEKIKTGETVTFAPLKEGEYNICGKQVSVTDCRMHPLYTVSRDTDHSLTEGYRKNDFSWWYDSSEDRLVPMIYATIEGEDMEVILTTGNKDDDGVWRKKVAVGQWQFGEGTVRVCQLDLDNKEKNPIAVSFINRL